MPLLHIDTGLDLFYAERGVGEPLLFLNGLSGDHLYWNGQLRSFSKRYRVIALDNPDVGQSTYPESGYSVRDLAGHVQCFLQTLHVPPAHVVGLSLGGMIALELAALAPERVRSLVIIGTPAHADPWYGATLRAFEVIRRHVPDTPAFFQAILPWWVSHRFMEQPQRVDWLLWLLRQNPHGQRLDGFLRQMAAIQGHDVREGLPKIRCPVVLLTGEDDAVCPPRYARYLAAALPTSRLVLMPGVGHAPPIEAPAEFTTQVAAFLASL